MYNNYEQKSQNIHNNVPFSPWRLLMHINSAFFATFRGLHTLTVNYRRTRLGITFFRLAHFLHQRTIDPFPQSIMRPAPIVTVHCSPRRKVFR